MVIHRRDFLSMFAAGYVDALAALEPANAFGAVLGPPTRELLTSLALSEASAQIASGTVSSVELTTACLDRIRIYNPKLETFITMLSEQAV